MIRMIDSFGERAGSKRVVIAILLGSIGLFLIGVAGGVVMSMIERGAMPSRLWVAALPFVTAPLGMFGVYAAWRLAALSKTSGY